MAFALQIVDKGFGHQRQGNPLRGLAPRDLDSGVRTPSELLRRAKASPESIQPMALFEPAANAKSRCRPKGTKPYGFFPFGNPFFPDDRPPVGGSNRPWLTGPAKQEKQRRRLAMFEETDDSKGDISIEAEEGTFLSRLDTDHVHPVKAK